MKTGSYQSQLKFPNKTWLTLCEKKMNHISFTIILPLFLMHSG